jgi:DNA-3-methyladenine glycosylase I
VIVGADGETRCDWCGDDPLYVAYHDEEWGRPLRDDRALFELLILEGAQAGLSWRTVLHKREGYRKAYRGFDPARIARFGAKDRERLLADAGIVRNRAKVDASIGNARAYLDLVEREGSFAEWIWAFVDGTPIVNRPIRLSDVPASTEISDRMSKQLKREGFKFVGTTICYAFMQAAGLVDDHLRDCFAARG